MSHLPRNDATRTVVGGNTSFDEMSLYNFCQDIFGVSEGEHGSEV
jgi:hypothetical protein